MASERIQRRIESLLDEADAAISRYDWETVRQASYAVLALSPENSDAATFLAAAERALGAVGTPPVPSAREHAEAIDPPPPMIGSPEAERRQLTVMFCDLQSSTQLSQQLDPEELREVIRSYQEVCAEAVGRFEGHIGKYLGDGLLVYFGYPQAHEDDPQRAVRAGLAIVGEMGTLNTRLLEDMNLELTVRIGVHTGLVVAGEMGSGETLEPMAVVGETPNIAARLQEVAGPNALVISDVTHRLIEGFFLSEDLGCHTLKGLSHPMELFRVVAESGAQTRFDVATATKLTAFVGREQEVGLLLDRWEQVKEGRGQAVLLSGEAGIGKSRLIEALSERLTEEPYTLRQLRCSAYHQNSALYPVAGYLERLLEFTKEESAEGKLRKLEGALAEVDFPLAESVPLLAELLSIQIDDRFPPLTLSPEGQRETTLELLVALLLQTANKNPVFIVVEDLHWADPSTLAMIGLLLDQAPAVQVLMLFSFRPEFSPPWSGRGYIAQIMLNRLTLRLAGEMISRLAGGKELPEEVLGHIASKSDGVPLFVEELTHMVIESGLLRELDDRFELNGPLAPLAIPSTLQDSLTARLDRLASVREVAQLGSVLGREFTFQLIQAVTPLEESTLRSQLQQLVTAEFLYQRGVPPEATYTFKHALIQDAAYESLLRSRRQQYHQQAARVLEERFSDTVDTQPELVAHHYAEAGLTAEAVPFWRRAGERALATYSHDEALVHFQRGLVAQGTPLEGSEPANGPETAALLFGLGRAQAATLPRHRIEEAVINLRRAFDYYAEVGEFDRAVAIAEYPFYPLIGQRSGNNQLIARALELVDPQSPRAALLLSRYGRIMGLEEGNYNAAQDALDKALAIAHREGDPLLEMRTLADAANVDLIHNRFRDSLEKAARAGALVNRADDPYSEVLMLYTAIIANLYTGDLEGGSSLAQTLLALAERLRDRFWLSMAYRINGDIAQLAGDWIVSRDLTHTSLSESPTEPRALCSRATLEYQVGDFAQGEEFFERLVEAMRRTPPGPAMENGQTGLAISFIARITGVPTRFDLANYASEQVLSSSTATPFVTVCARIAMALLSVQRGDILTAGEHYAALATYQGTMWMFVMVGVDRVLALLAQTMGNLEQAIDHFEDSLAFCRNAGYRPELAWTCCDYADTLVMRASTSSARTESKEDRRKAVSLLDEALAISRELGMRPLMERVLSRRKLLRV